MDFTSRERDRDESGKKFWRRVSSSCDQDSAPPPGSSSLRNSEESLYKGHAVGNSVEKVGRCRAKVPENRKKITMSVSCSMIQEPVRTWQNKMMETILVEF
ncbi:hypothetical protein IGI04_019782 [Brassica rapa subsp. trilocularis]|uniref:Uncharacterized protein n=1 Tax=Brassica rapa subsp. trilocularis TaxID=1813537 RepID=A0ABQ7MGU3_BRACM|nr:hypothetical protein IGI04_019782 [Brassica rapa subsp. trilocularis]